MSKIQTTTKNIADYLRDNGDESYLVAGGKRAIDFQPWTLVEIMNFDAMAALRDDVRESFNKASFAPGLVAYSLYKDNDNGHHLAVVRDSRTGYFNTKAQATIYTCLLFTHMYDAEQAQERGREWAGKQMAWITRNP